MSNVGRQIKKYLNEHGISQLFISRKTKIDSIKLNLMLNDKRRITLEEYALICGVLEVNTDEFLKPQILEKKEE